MCRSGVICFIFKGESRKLSSFLFKAFFLKDLLIMSYDSEKESRFNVSFISEVRFMYIIFASLYL